MWMKTILKLAAWVLLVIIVAKDGSKSMSQVPLGEVVVCTTMLVIMFKEDK